MLKRALIVILRFPKKHRKLWAGLRSILTGVAPVVLAVIAYFYVPEPQIGEAAQALTPMKAFARDHPYLLWLLLPMPIIITALAEWYEYFGDVLIDRHDLSSVESLCVLTALDEIVGCKSKRFAAKLDEIRREKPPITDIFDRITDPQTQIVVSVTQLHMAIRELTQDHTLRTVLCEFSEGMPRDFPVYLPSSSKPRGTLLGATGRKTFFAHIYQKNAPLHIQDIKKHIKSKKKPKLFFAEDGEEEAGSIVGFPVYHSHLEKIPFVLTYRSERVGGLSEDFIKKHKLTIDRFIKRICLECTLKEIQLYARKSA